MEINFKGKRVLITGGAKGLGQTLVKRFCSSGAEKVFTIDVDQVALQLVKEEHPNIVTAVVDLRNWDDTKKIIEGFGPIDILVNNAGIVGRMPNIGEIDKAEINLMMDVNFSSVINVTQSVVENMPNGGSIVNLSSVLSKCTSDGMCLYSCTKAAIVMLTKSMALELGLKMGIRVNCVCPTGVNTALMGQIFGRNPSRAEASLQRFVFPRAIETAEVADLIIFLASDKSTMITGQDYIIDGGFMTN